MAGILQFCARSLPRNVRKAARTPFERTNLELESFKTRDYHRNVSAGVAIAAYRTCIQKFCLDTKCQSSLLINRSIQTTSVLGTSKDVVVPQFADSISEGDVQFLKKAGDSVEEDDIVCEIETDKTSVEVPSPGKGVIEELYVENGSVVKPGMKLFKIKLEG